MENRRRLSFLKWPTLRRSPRLAAARNTPQAEVVPVLSKRERLELKLSNQPERRAFEQQLRKRYEQKKRLQEKELAEALREAEAAAAAAISAISAASTSASSSAVAEDRTGDKMAEVSSKQKTEK